MVIDYQLHASTNEHSSSWSLAVISVCSCHHTQVTEHSTGTQAKAAAGGNLPIGAHRVVPDNQLHASAGGG